jgi:pimeloyl-ACP methyl ester carboxylesterase
VDFDYAVAPLLLLLAGVVVVWLSVGRILTLKSKAFRLWRRIAEEFVLTVVILIIAVIAGSASYNAVAHHWFRAHNPPGGEFYLVNGHRMRMECMGNGSPTIVLESGLGTDALVWGAVQPALAKTTRVCSYDRAGLGWSDAVAGPRDADHIAAQLHELLLQANVSGPIVLMGHSIAGVYLRETLTRYPEQVAGLVLVDSSTPYQHRNPSMKAAEAKLPPIGPQLLLYRSAMILGLPRLFGSCSRTLPGFDPHAGSMEAEADCAPSVWTAMREEDGVEESNRETEHTGPFGALPILIFSHDPAGNLPKVNPPQPLVEYQQAWSQLQEDLKKLSTRSRRIIARGSGHTIQLDRPDVLTKEVPVFIEQIRGAAPQPASYGSTITE